METIGVIALPARVHKLHAGGIAVGAVSGLPQTDLATSSVGLDRFTLAASTTSIGPQRRQPHPIPPASGTAIGWVPREQDEPP